MPDGNVPRFPSTPMVMVDTRNGLPWRSAAGLFFLFSATLGLAGCETVAPNRHFQVNQVKNVTGITPGGDPTRPNGEIDIIHLGMLDTSGSTGYSVWEQPTIWNGNTKVTDYTMPASSTDNKNTSCTHLIVIEPMKTETSNTPNQVVGVYKPSPGKSSQDCQNALRSGDFTNMVVHIDTLTAGDPNAFMMGIDKTVQLEETAGGPATLIIGNGNPFNTQLSFQIQQGDVGDGITLMPEEYVNYKNWETDAGQFIKAHQTAAPSPTAIPTPVSTPTSTSEQSLVTGQVEVLSGPKPDLSGALGLLILGAGVIGGAGLWIRKRRLEKNLRIAGQIYSNQANEALKEKARQESPKPSSHRPKTPVIAQAEIHVPTEPPKHWWQVRMRGPYYRDANGNVARGETNGDPPKNKS